MDSRTISGLLIGYLKKSKGYRFYYPKHRKRIVETRNVRFIDNDEVSGSLEPRKVEIQEVRVQVPLHITSSQVVVHVHVDHVDDKEEQQINDQTSQNEVVMNEPIIDEPQKVILRRSIRQKRYVFLMTMWFIYKSRNLT